MDELLIAADKGHRRLMRLVNAEGGFGFQKDIPNCGLVGSARQDLLSQNQKK